MDMLGMQSIPGTPGQLEKLRRWIESVVDERGSTFVRGNRPNFLRLWELHMKVRAVEKINSPVLLVFWSDFRVAPAGEYEKYAPAGAP